MVVRTPRFLMSLKCRLLVILVAMCCPLVVTAAGEGGSKAQSPAFTPDEMFQDMFPLTKQNFTQRLLRSRDPWIVLFHDGELEKQWKTMAVHLRGLVWIGMVDKAQQKELLEEMQYDTSRDSVARVYPYGGRQRKVEKWEPAKTPNEARSKAAAFLPDRTTLVTPGTLQDFLMMCYTATPTKFPALFLTDEKDTTPLLKALSVRFEKYFNFGRVVSPSPEDLTKLGLDKVFVDTPALYVLVTDQSDQNKFSAVQYDKTSFGHMNYTSIMQFLFAINSNFRHTLLGDNQANQQQEAEMSDVLDIESQRFDILSPGRRESTAQKKQEVHEKHQGFKMSFETNFPGKKDEL